MRKIEIQKVSKLVNPESFIQVNTVKGFKYIDKAGEIVNLYHSGKQPPQFSMGLQGLVIERPKKKIELLKVSSDVFWTKFTEIDSFDQTVNTFSNDAEMVLSILEVSELSRIGWRNYFIYEFANAEEQTAFIDSIINVHELKPTLCRFEVETKKDFSVNLMFQPVIKHDETKTPGVLFDVDIFKSSELRTNSIKETLDTFRKYLTDQDGLVLVLNSILSLSKDVERTS